MDATEKKKEETARVERGVFVRNLDFTTTSSELETTFESVGPIKSCFVVTDPGTGKSRGYGYVAPIASLCESAGW
jgi:nucleolar protein 4